MTCNDITLQTVENSVVLTQATEEIVLQSHQNTIQLDTGDDVLNIEVQETSIDIIIDSTIEVAPSEEQYDAGENLSAHRIVKTDINGDVIYGDSTDTSNVDSFIGITKTAAVTGGNVVIITRGEVDDAVWSWTPRQSLYLNGTTGDISQTPPTSGLILKIGHALTATKVYVRFSRAIIQA